MTRFRPRGAAYLAVHDKCRHRFGGATKHLCIGCFRPARDWAYLFTGERKTDPASGRPYSDSVEDYAPMCRSCHMRWDVANDPEYAEKLRQAGKTVGRRPRTEAHRDAIVVANRARTSHLPALHAAARKRYQCGGCELKSHPAGIARHQSVSGHEGREEVS